MVLVVKNSPASAGDIRNAGSIPGWGRSSGEGNDNPLQYSCLENPMDRGAWRATVHGVAKSLTRLGTSVTPVWCSPIFMWIQVSDLYHFPSPWRTSFNISFRVYLPGTDSLKFYLSESPSPTLLKDNSVVFKIPAWRISLAIH